MKIRFQLQNYNEFKSWMRWHDYLAIMVNEFPIILIRKYDWLDTEEYTFSVNILGFKVYQKIGKMT